MKNLTLIALLASSLLALVSPLMASTDTKLYYPGGQDLDLSPHYYSASYTKPNHAPRQTLEYSHESVKVQVFGGPGSNMTTYVLNLSTGTIVKDHVGPAIPSTQTTIAANYCPIKSYYVEALEAIAAVVRDFAMGDGEYNEPNPELEPFSRYLASAQQKVIAGCK